MLQWIDQPWVNRRLPHIRQVIDSLKFRFSRTERKHKSVASFLLLRGGGDLHSLAALSLRLGIVDVAAIGNVELKISIVHLSARRGRRVVHGKNTRNPKLSS